MVVSFLWAFTPLTIFHCGCARLATFYNLQSKMLGPIFKEFDSDGNGFLDQKELALLVRKSLEAQREYLPDMMLKLTLAEVWSIQLSA